MDASKRTPSYDLFKLIVAIILLLIFLFLLRLRPAPVPLSNIPITRTAGPAIPSPTASSISDSPTSPPPAFQSVTGTSASSESTSTPPPPVSPSGTSASINSTATPPPDPSATSIPLSTPPATPMPEATSTPLVATETLTVSACDAATSRSRLQTGMTATILRRLNFRSSPGIRDNWLRTNIPGTQVEVVGGPQCVPYWTSAYLWWQVKLPDGSVGWSAEGSLHGSFYFMEPTK